MASCAGARSRALWAWLRGAPPPPIPISAASRIAGAQTRGTTAQARGLGKRGLAAFFYRRDAAAVMLTIALWLFGLWARPDFWGGLDNSFAILLAFSEIALLAVGLTFVMANGDIDLSVGSVLALSGAVAAVVMKDTDLGPLRRGRASRSRPASLAGAINGWLTAYVGLPAFIATLGTFYWARGIGSSIVAGTQLNGFPEIVQPDRAQPLRTARRAGRRARPKAGRSRSPRRSACRRSSSSLVALVARRSCSPRRRSARRSTRSAATSARRASPASTPAACASRRW